MERRLQGKLPIVIFNGPIITAPGLYEVTNLDVAKARALLAEHGFVSAVGHSSTAEVLSQLLEVPVKMNRVQYVQRPGQKAIALKLNVRAPEGQVLSVDELEKIGFELQLIDRLK